MYSLWVFWVTIGKYDVGLQEYLVWSIRALITQLSHLWLKMAMIMQLKSCHNFASRFFYFFTKMWASFSFDFTFSKSHLMFSSHSCFCTHPFESSHFNLPFNPHLSMAERTEVEKSFICCENSKSSDSNREESLPLLAHCWIQGYTFPPLPGKECLQREATREKESRILPSALHLYFTGEPYPKQCYELGLKWPLAKYPVLSWYAFWVVEKSMGE